MKKLRHDFGGVFAWVEQGEPVEISKRGKIIAILSPPPRPKPAKTKKRPDFAARLKRIYGDLVLPGDVVAEEREGRGRKVIIAADLVGQMATPEPMERSPRSRANQGIPYACYHY
ncbi:MAG: type II toxin-antitoxin system prevent-host-death family antitoxin [Verrucomicrobiota bacterium]